MVGRPWRLVNPGMGGVSCLGVFVSIRLSAPVLLSMTLSQFTGSIRLAARFPRKG
jgi:hypothetical protein